MPVLRPMRLIYMDCNRFWEMAVNGRYVEEAAEVFETRVKACQKRRESHLHMYGDIFKYVTDM